MYICSRMLSLFIIFRPIITNLITLLYYANCCENDLRVKTLKYTDTTTFSVNTGKSKGICISI